MKQPCNIIMKPWPLTYIKRATELKRVYNAWKLRHSTCPDCGNTKLMITSVPIHWKPGMIYRDTKNIYVCPRCNSHGRVSKLKPLKV